MEFLRRIAAIILAGSNCFALISAAAVGGEWRFDARRIDEVAEARNVRLARDGSALELDRGELIHDDGPAAGYSYRPNEEPLGEEIRVRKELVLDDPRAASAVLLVGPGGALQGTLNGTSIALAQPRKAGNYWQQYSIPADLLKAGANELILWGKGKLWIAREDEYAAGAAADRASPKRSARSGDAGTTWKANRLGPRGDIGGEYCIRLHLDRFRTSGWFKLPVLDLGSSDDSPIAAALDVSDLKAFVTTVVEGEAAEIAIRLRSGPTPSPDSGWSEWKDLAVGSDMEARVAGRFVELKADLSTKDRLRSPRLRQIIVRSTPKPATTWQRNWKASEFQNGAIVRSCIPFRYEPFDHPRLKQFRRQHRLDDVVAGAKTELEQIERLASWASRQWQNGHLAKEYPAWDALDILAPHADGTPVGGFCQQYNLVLLQAAESFGIPGRCVSIGSGDHGVDLRSGHETVELWSNEFRKWVYIDGNAAWHFVDPGSRAPLSLRELRARQLNAIRKQPYDPVECMVLAKTRYTWTDLTGWPAFAELRLIPRSNFLEQKAPLPLNQGMRGWFWTGHVAWSDDDYPASLLYGERAVRSQDWDWTLNQTRIVLEATRTPGEVRVHLESDTPVFERWLGAVDGESPKDVRNGFLWKLHAGENALTVRSQNIAGRAGSPSRVVLVQKR